MCCKWWVRMQFSFLANMWVGAFQLFTTGRMGMLGLCSVGSALSVGGDGFCGVGI
jgi:hypothetical protein